MRAKEFAHYVCVDYKKHHARYARREEVGARGVLRREKKKKKKNTKRGITTQGS